MIVICCNVEDDAQSDACPDGKNIFHGYRPDFVLNDSVITVFFGCPTVV
jgi:hypothetical protein